MARIIYTHQLEEFAAALKHEGVVFAPIEKHLRSGGSKYAFSEYQKGQKIIPAYPATILPPKEFLLPPEDVLFEFSNGKTKIPKPAKQIIFGVNYEDLEGLARLKQIFAKPIADEPFTARAANTVIVAIDRFSPPRQIGFDVYLQQIGGGRLAAFAGSPTGQKILKNSLFKTEKISITRVTKKVDPLLSNPNLRLALQKSKGHQVWDDLAERCFACGVCAFVCPMCYCFETKDKTTLPATEPVSGVRVREWSSCFSPDFAKTAGHNFRAERRDRIYNWYFHKFVRMEKEHGFDGCVDCGRCITFCPARINYRTVLTEVLKEYEARQK